MSPTSTQIKEGLTPAVELMQRVLRDGAPLADEYPLVFRTGFPGRVVALSDAQGPRSACAILARDFVMPGARLSVGLIGSVSTDPEYRGRGLATRVLNEAEEALAKLGCSVAMLWGDDPSFYYRRGYRPVGHECDFEISNAKRERLPEPRGARPARPADAKAIHSLYRSHPVRVDRTVDETTALLECPEMQTIVIERSGEPVAYACLGRGQDLAGIVHEWAGATEDVLALLRAHLESMLSTPQTTGAVYVMVPPTASDLRDRLVSLDFASLDGVLGLGKVLDRAAVGLALQERIHPEGSVLVEDDAHGAARVYLVGRTCGVELTDDDLLHLLMPARGIRTEIDDLAKGFGLDLAGLPLQPFCWGLDSI